jgi:predicted ATPase
VSAYAGLGFTASILPKAPVADGGDFVLSTLAVTA